MELVLLIGIPAAGKSTFYQRCLASTHYRVNLDTLKRRPRELRFVQECIAARKPFAVDNTNVLSYDRARYIPLAKAAEYKIVGYWFDCPVRDAQDRNSRRDGASWVPPHVIDSFHAKTEKPDYDEGFDNLFRVIIDGRRYVVKPMRCRAKKPVPTTRDLTEELTTFTGERLHTRAGTHVADQPSLPSISKGPSR